MNKDPGTETGIHSRTGRYKFLDVYRGLFVLLMLQGHTLRETLVPAAMNSTAFQIHELLHGITGPGFFFGAGFTFAISAQRRWEDLTHWSPGLLRRIGRALLLVIVGFALHVPYHSLSKTIIESTPAQWAEFLAFGVLQCIGISLLVLYLLLATLRNERRFVIVLVILLPAMIYLAAPLAEWANDPAIPLVIRSAFATNTGSYYPILPYAGFIVAGAVTSWGFLRSGQGGREHQFMKWVMVLGAVLIVLALLAEHTLVPWPDDEQYWKVGPNFFWVRLGILCVFLSLLWVFEEHLEFLPSWIAILGVESFFVYIAHLPVLYGWVTNPALNLSAYFNGSVSFLGALVLFAAMVPPMILGATVWRSLKKNQLWLVRWGILWALVLMGHAYVANPF